MLGEIQIRMRLRVSGDRKEIRQSYIPTLFPKLVEPLQSKGTVRSFPLRRRSRGLLTFAAPLRLPAQDGIEEVIQLMDDYYLTKDDWDAIVELGIGEGFTNDEVLKLIPSATKSAFTRTYVCPAHPRLSHGI